MHKISTISLVVLTLAIIFVAFNIRASYHGSKDEPKDEEVLSESIGSVETSEINFDGKLFLATWAEVSTENVELIPNFSDKKTAKNVFRENSCSVLINAGFYQNDGVFSHPIGYFQSGDEVTSNYQDNKLFNGILSINSFDTPRITRNVPQDPLLLAVQTGPILKENGQIQDLNLARDKGSRRMIAAITGRNSLIFISIYSKDANLSGPYLEDLPNIIHEFENKTGVLLADAVNLDGGSASAFYANNFSLSEVSPIGSFFCVK